MPPEKIDPSVLSQLEAAPDTPIEVLLVYGPAARSGPDLSFMIGGEKRDYSQPLQTSPLQDAEARLRDRLSELGITPKNWLTNAGTVVLELDRAQLDALAASEDVREVVLNTRLKGD